MRYQVLLLDRTHNTSTVLAQFRYSCDAHAFKDDQTALMHSLSMEFTVEHNCLTVPEEEVCDYCGCTDGNHIITTKT